MASFHKLTGTLAPLPESDVDTDQIIPARFLKVTTKDGLGKALFADWRYHEDGSEKAGFVLNRPEYAGATLLLAGANFGCGSSREHAPWALVSYGFRAVIAPSFADIFANNSLKNGLLPIVATPLFCERVLAAVTQDPSFKLTIDLEAQLTIAGPLGDEPFTIDGFARRCLLDGVDELGYLLAHAQRIDAYESAHATPQQP